MSIPRYGTGSLMQQAQVHLETVDVLAVTLALIIISYICQKIMSHGFDFANAKSI